MPRLYKWWFGSPQSKKFWIRTGLALSEVWCCAFASPIPLPVLRPCHKVYLWIQSSFKLVWWNSHWMKGEGIEYNDRYVQHRKNYLCSRENRCRQYRNAGDGCREQSKACPWAKHGLHRQWLYEFDRRIQPWAQRLADRNLWKSIKGGFGTHFVPIYRRFSGQGGINIKNIFQRICERLTNHRFRKGQAYSVGIEPTEYHYRCRICQLWFWNFTPFRGAPPQNEGYDSKMLDKEIKENGFLNKTSFWWTVKDSLVVQRQLSRNAW